MTYLVGHEVVEGVVATFKRLLVGESRFLQKINHHVGSRKFSRLSKLKWIKYEIILKLPG